MTNWNWKEHLLYVFFTVFILLQFFSLLFCSSAYGVGGADNITHFQIARYAFRHPELFLDLWGKPVYTTLCAPFAQLGFLAAKFFNVIAAVLATYLNYKIGKDLYPRSSFYVLVFTAFAPVYFMLSGSCLTEILFSLVLVASVYLFLKERMIFAAIVLSFLPLVRSEGFVVFPVFALAMILKQSYKSIPFLLFGSIVYSLIGYFVFHDFLWLIHKQPYSMGESIYGSGSLFHFIKHSHFIFGIPLLVILVPGLIIWCVSVLKNFSLKSEKTILFIIIVGSWLTYFAAHSYVWWKGTGGSLGLTRVMAGIVPFVALTGVQTIEKVIGSCRKKMLAQAGFGVLALLQIVLLFTQNKLIQKPDPTERLIKECADYLRFNEEGKKVFYFNPLLIHYLNLDPYDTKQCNWWVADKMQPSNSMEWGDVIVWDAHFGPNEGGVQLQALDEDPYLLKLKSFYPMEKVTVLGGYDYSVQVYKKSMQKNDTTLVADDYRQVLNFDNDISAQTKEIEGVRAWEINDMQEYSPSIIITPDRLTRYETFDISVTLSYRSLDSIQGDQVMLVFSLENGTQNLRYEKVDLVTTGNEWKEMELTLKMPANIPETSRMLVYVWNKDRKKLMIQQIEVKIKSY